ncbi:unnamed protein product [Cylindrotheca closterium]|uniref:Uncharacterized protein n=1 Tax=Cylindrotheca closterium TaxID=2856 RepID=A0AAD2G386_9STRA|nr:unnamed protein product [Cylindrotheca closterium]
MGRLEGSNNKKATIRLEATGSQGNFKLQRRRKLRQAMSTSSHGDIKMIHPLQSHHTLWRKQLVAEILDHPSVPKGKFVPNQGTVDFTSGNAWEVKYDEDDDGSANGVGDYGIGASSDEDKSSASSTRYCQLYTPSQGTPLYNYLMEVQGKIIDDKSCQQQKFIHPRNHQWHLVWGNLLIQATSTKMLWFEYGYQMHSSRACTTNTSAQVANPFNQHKTSGKLAPRNCKWGYPLGLFLCQCSNKACKNKTFLQSAIWCQWGVRLEVTAVNLKNNIVSI